MKLTIALMICAALALSGCSTLTGLLSGEQPAQPEQAAKAY